jgi:3D (Asp-Asp-Asp) domain-containing protein
MIRKKAFILGLCVGFLLLFCAFVLLANGSSVSTMKMNKKTRSYKLLGGFSPTFYRILNESAPEWKAEAQTEALLDVSGALIERVVPSFKSQLDIEGSARLRDGRVVNLHEKMNGSWRYMVAHDAPFGLGLDGYKLIPFRTLAVDPEVIRPGTVLYIPALDGVKLPSGEIHDGFFFAHDEGQSITGMRIDVFVGYESDVDNTLTRSGRIEDMGPVQLYQVDEKTAEQQNEKYKSRFAR